MDAVIGGEVDSGSRAESAVLEGTSAPGSPDLFWGSSWRRVSAWVRAHPDLSALSLVGLAVLVAAGVSWRSWGDISIDTGYDMLAAKRLAAGEIPYVDFQYFYGALPLGLLALVFVAFGSSIATAIGFGLVVATLIVFGTYAMVRCVSGAANAALAAGLVVGPAFAATNNSYVLPHTVSATLGTLLLLGLVLAVSRWAHTDRLQPALLAGGLLGCLVLTRPEFVAAGAAGLALLLVLRWRNGLLSFREVVAVVVPAVVVPALVFGALLTRTSPGELFFENLWPRAQLAAGSNEVLRIHAPLTADSFARLGGAAAAYGGLCLALVVGSRILRRLGPRVAVTLTAAAVVLAAAVGLMRPETVRYYLNFAYEWIPFGALVAAAFIGGRLIPRRSTATPERQVDAVAVAVLAVLAATHYAVFLPLGPVAQPAVYFAPFAAYFLVRLHLGSVARRMDARALGAVWLVFVATAGGAILLGDGWSEKLVNGPGGALAAPASESAGLQKAVTWIDATARPGEPVLIAPQLAIVSFLADRPAPQLRQLNLIPSALPRPADERAVIERLDDEHLRVALIDTRAYPAYGYAAGFGTGYYFELDRWLRREFRLDATFATGDRQLEGWVRR